jgi:hypothetical protein
MPGVGVATRHCRVPCLVLGACLLACLLGALIELFLANENLPRGSLGVCHFQPLNLDVGDSSALALEDFLPPSSQKLMI